MTDLASALTTERIDTVPLSARTVAVWRALSLLSVLAAVVIVALSALGARNASDVAAPESSTIPVEQASVVANGLTLPTGTQIAVLGLEHAVSRQPFDESGTEVEVPKGLAALVGLYDPDGSLIGLSLAPGSQDRTVIEVSPASTARALVALSPGVLRPNLDETLANTEVIAQDPAMETLVAALGDNSNLTLPNAPVEAAYAAIADRVPAQQPPSDQGCDSIADTRAYAAAGACVQPRPTGLLISNKQDRWALVFEGADGSGSLCAVVGPVRQSEAEQLVTFEQCAGEALIVAPGPASDEGANEARVRQRVRIAAALNQLYSYTGPFAELAAGGAGSGGDLSLHIAANGDSLVGSIEELTERSDPFNEALDVSTSASTPIERERAALTVARLLIEASNTSTLLPARHISDTQHLALLDFYDRASVQLVASRSDWRWAATGVGTIDFGATS